MPCKEKLLFNTAIITYPSDYDGLLDIGLIMQKFEEITYYNPGTKVVIAKETADDEIQRDHYHLYYDSEKRKGCTTKYFDIKLPEPVVVFINPDEKKTRTYQTLSDLQSKLGSDNQNDMVPLLDQYVNNENNFIKGTTYDILSVAHPNIQLKKCYGDKYLMLRYVVKQRLVTRANFDVIEELKWLEEEREKLLEKTQELIESGLLQQLNVETVEELIILLRKYKLKCLRKAEQNKRRGRRGRRSKSGLDSCFDNEEDVYEFRMWLRKKILERKLTKKEVLDDITKDERWWPVYCGNYINYSKLITDMFRGKPPAKPTPDYNLTFWVPCALYDYLMWLDKWVEKWETGQPLEKRPKGLVLIGPSRTGKTSLMSCLGNFSYFKNIWNLDCWEGRTAFTIMDDMDAGDEGKGLSFCWYKPFFGAQEAITVTDKFKPKEDIYNGKPLIWINNYKIEETFQSKTAQDYIDKNMYIIKLERPLFEKPRPGTFQMLQYKEFDPKTTWYYKNKIIGQKQNEKCTNNNNNNEMSSDDDIIFVNENNKQRIICESSQSSTTSSDTSTNNNESNEKNMIEIECKECNAIDYILLDEKENWKCSYCGCLLYNYTHDEEMPLNERKRNLFVVNKDQSESSSNTSCTKSVNDLFNEIGRLIKRTKK